MNANLTERFQQLIEQTRQDGRQLVSVRIVDDLIPIPKADRIETAMIGGWPVVVKKGEFQVGQMAVFFEPDSFLDADDPRFAFLAEKRVVTKNEDGSETVHVSKTPTEWNGIEGIRLKTIKLKKQLSQGLLLPLDLFPEIAVKQTTGNWLIYTYYKGDPDRNAVILPAYPDELSSDFQLVRSVNYTTKLNVVKWEKIEKEPSVNMSGRSKGNFPTFLRKSDQPRVQGMNNEVFGYEPRNTPIDTAAIEAMGPEAFTALRERGLLLPDGQGGYFRRYPAQADRDTRYEATIKMDGSSMTVYVNEGTHGVCSRNLELDMEEPANAENAFVKTAREQVLPILLAGNWGNIALQGELVGPGIQGNPEGLDSLKFFVYNIFDIDLNAFLLPEDRQEMLNRMNHLYIDEGGDGNILLNHVPILHTNVKLSEVGITDMASMLAYSDGKGYRCAVREGIVWKAMHDSQQFKAISNVWQLANDSRD